MDNYEKHYLKNINLINFKKDYSVEREDFIGDSIIMTGTSDYPWTYISLAVEDDLEAVMRLLRPEDDRIMIQDECVLDYLKARYEFEWIMSCKKFVYQGDVIVQSENVYELKSEDADYIQSMNDYGDFTDVSYIRERIEKGIGLGVKDGEKLIAWVLTHDDGAIGFIKVLEGHRNKGYANQLTNEVIRRLQKLNQVPFVHIESGNIKSINLAVKVGFKYFGDVHWVKLSKE